MLRPMKRISSNYVPLVKWVMPAVVVAVAILSGGSNWFEQFAGAATMTVIAFAVAFYVTRRQTLGLADTVHDAGDRLIVKRGLATESVPLREISGVSLGAYRNMPIVVLQLRTPRKMGSEIAFVPFNTRDRRVIDRLIADLRNRSAG
jgi:hypothetical protein